MDRGIVWALELRLSASYVWEWPAEPLFGALLPAWRRPAPRIPPPRHTILGRVVRGGSGELLVVVAAKQRSLEPPVGLISRHFAAL